MNRLGHIHCSAYDWCNNGTSRVVVHRETDEVRFLCVPHARELQRQEPRTWTVCSADSDYIFKARRKTKT